MIINTDWSKIDHAFWTVIRYTTHDLLTRQKWWINIYIILILRHQTSRDRVFMENYQACVAIPRNKIWFGVSHFELPYTLDIIHINKHLTSKLSMASMQTMYVTKRRQESLQLYCKTAISHQFTMVVLTWIKHEINNNKTLCVWSLCHTHSPHSSPMHGIHLMLFCAISPAFPVHLFRKIVWHACLYAWRASAYAGCGVCVCVCVRAYVWGGFRGHTHTNNFG